MELRMKLDHVLTAFDSLHDRPHNSARRSFLLGSLGILALARFEYARAAMPSQGRLSPLEVLLDSLGEEKCIRELGKIFLASSVGRHFDRQHCLERISQELEAHAAIHRGLEHLITTDFAHGTTVQLEGWVLSRTEVELCALCTK
jgi:hypothetical protein